MGKNRGHVASLADIEKGDADEPFAEEKRKVRDCTGTAAGFGDKKLNRSRGRFRRSGRDVSRSSDSFSSSMNDERRMILAS